MAFFSDEKIFKLTQLLNVQNNRTYAPSAYKKSTIQNKRLYVERGGFPMSLMVSVAVSKVGKLSIFFVEPGAKVNGAYYREKLLASVIPEMDRLTGYQPYVFMQDGARSHTANEKVRFLNLNQQRYLTLLQPNKTCGLLTVQILIQSITAFGALWSEMFTAEEDLKTP